MPRSQAEYKKERYRTDPLFRRQVKIHAMLCDRRAGRVSSPIIPTAQLEQELSTIKAQLSSQRAEKRAVRDAQRDIEKERKAVERAAKSPPNIFKLRNGTRVGFSPAGKRLHPELHRRNKLQWEANLELSEQRKAASAEYKELIAGWTEKWGHVLNSDSTSRKRARARRTKRMADSVIPGDKALLRQITTIKVGPCKCFWCEKLLPLGGTVDHIKALANGGSHTSDNICAACTDCNSAKSDKAPVTDTPALF